MSSSSLIKIKKNTVLYNGIKDKRPFSDIEEFAYQGQTCRGDYVIYCSPSLSVAFAYSNKWVRIYRTTQDIYLLNITSDQEFLEFEDLKELEETVPGFRGFYVDWGYNKTAEELGIIYPHEVLSLKAIVNKNELQ